MDPIEFMKVAINWSWGNYGLPGSPGDWYEIGPNIRRGQTPPHDCVVNAIQAGRNGHREIALNWLACTQSHNEDARQAILHAGEAAVDYAIQAYGAEVPGAPTQLATPVTANRVTYKVTSGTGSMEGSVWMKNIGTQKTADQTIGSYKDPSSVAFAFGSVAQTAGLNPETSGPKITIDFNHEITATVVRFEKA